MERSAAGSHLCCSAKFNNSLFPDVLNNSASYLSLPINDKWNDTLNKNKYELTEGLKDICEKDANGECLMNNCTDNLMMRAVKYHGNINMSDFVGMVSSGVIKPDRMLHDNEIKESKNRKLVRLSCQSTEGMWFDLMASYGDMGGFLSVVSIIGIVLYFVTSSDSGSLVIDCLSANGDPDPPAIQVTLHSWLAWRIQHVFFHLIRKVRTQFTKYLA